MSLYNVIKNKVEGVLGIDLDGDGKVGEKEISYKCSTCDEEVEEFCKECSMTACRHCFNTAPEYALHRHLCHKSQSLGRICALCGAHGDDVLYCSQCHVLMCHKCEVRAQGYGHSKKHRMINKLNAHPTSDIIHDFADNTSAHGLYQAAHKDWMMGHNPKIRRWTWGAITLTFFCLGIYFIYQPYKRYIENGTITTYEYKYRTYQEFPNVTICSHTLMTHAYKGSRYMANDTTVDTYGLNLVDVMQSPILTSPCLFGNEEEQAAMVECEQNWTTARHHTFGDCFTFNLGSIRDSARVTETGSRQTLNLILSTQQEHAHHTDQNAGFMVAIHAKDREADFTSMLHARSGTSTNIQMQREVFDRVSNPYTNCTPSNEELVTCKNRVESENVLSACNCRAHMLNARNSRVPWCFEAQDGVPTSQENADCASAELARTQTYVLSQRCTLPCQSTSYRTRYSVSAFPAYNSEPVKTQAHNECVDDIRKALIMVKLDGCDTSSLLRFQRDLSNVNKTNDDGCHTFVILPEPKRNDHGTYMAGFNNWYLEQIKTMAEQGSGAHVNINLQGAARRILENANGMVQARYTADGRIGQCSHTVVEPSGIALRVVKLGWYSLTHYVHDKCGMSLGLYHNIGAAGFSTDPDMCRTTIEGYALADPEFSEFSEPDNGIIGPGNVFAKTALTKQGTMGGSGTGGSSNSGSNIGGEGGSGNSDSADADTDELGGEQDQGLNDYSDSTAADADELGGRQDMDAFTQCAVPLCNYDEQMCSEYLGGAECSAHSFQHDPDQDYHRGAYVKDSLKYAAIKVSFYDLNDVSITTAREYTGVSFLAEVGGLWGLFTGFSFITMVEAVELGFVLLIWKVVRRIIRKLCGCKPQQKAGALNRSASIALQAAPKDVRMSDEHSRSPRATHKPHTCIPCSAARSTTWSPTPHCTTGDLSGTTARETLSPSASDATGRAQPIVSFGK